MGTQVCTHRHKTQLPPVSALERACSFPPEHLLYCRDGASHDAKALDSVPAGRTDSTTITSDATEYALRRLQPATKYEIRVKSVRGREESEVASITVYTGGKELLVGR